MKKITQFVVAASVAMSMSVNDDSVKTKEYIETTNNVFTNKQYKCRKKKIKQSKMSRRKNRT